MSNFEKRFCNSCKVNIVGHMKRQEIRKKINQENRPLATKSPPSKPSKPLLAVVYIVPERISVEATMERRESL